MLLSSCSVLLINKELSKLNKACFAHDGAYSDSKDLAKRTTADKILKSIPYKIVRNGAYGGYQRALACLMYKFS